MDCCVHGASRWAVKEARLGGSEPLENEDLTGPFSLLALVCVVPGDRSSVTGFGVGTGVRGTARERTGEFLPVAQGCFLVQKVVEIDAFIRRPFLPLSSQISK